VTQIRSPVLLLPCFLGYPKSKPNCAGILAAGGELLFVSRILIAASRRAKVQDLAPGPQWDRSLFSHVHAADRIAD